MGGAAGGTRPLTLRERQCSVNSSAVPAGLRTREEPAHANHGAPGPCGLVLDLAAQLAQAHVRHGPAEGTATHALGHSREVQVLDRDHLGGVDDPTAQLVLELPALIADLGVEPAYRLLRASAAVANRDAGPLGDLGLRVEARQPQLVIALPGVAALVAPQLGELSLEVLRGLDLLAGAEAHGILQAHVDPDHRHGGFRRRRRWDLIGGERRVPPAGTVDADGHRTQSADHRLRHPEADLADPVDLDHAGFPIDLGASLVEGEADGTHRPPALELREIRPACEGVAEAALEITEHLIERFPR